MLRYNNVTPTDIDCFVEIADVGYWLLEIKSGMSLLRGGQRLALTRLIDALTDAGKIAILVVGRAEPGDQDISAGDCPVIEYRFKKMWRYPSGRTVRDLWEQWLRCVRSYTATDNPDASSTGGGQA